MQKEIKLDTLTWLFLTKTIVKQRRKGGLNELVKESKFRREKISGNK
jgi:hypothetical protein